jgi:peptidoglycan/xylan/chitin deacetylase (PgdA/CDA1 family)
VTRSLSIRGHFCPSSVSLRRRAKGLVVGALCASFLGLVSVSGRQSSAGAAPLSEGLISLTFDDGWKTQWDVVRPELNARGYKGTFALLSQALRENWTCCVTVAQARQLQTEGHEIASHSVSHPNLTALSLTAATNEIVTAKTELQGWFGGQIPGFVSPLGAYNNQLLSVIRANHRWHRTIFPGLIETETVIDQLPSYDVNYFTRAQILATIDQAIAERKWAILTFHEVVLSGAATSTQINRADFVAILNHIRRRGVRVVTVSQGVARLAGRTSPPDVTTTVPPTTVPPTTIPPTTVPPTTVPPTTVPPTTVPGTVAMTIYDDALRNGFQSWSWATVNTSYTSIARSGTAISVEPDNWAALYLHSDTLNLSTYATLRFWIYPTGPGQQLLDVVALQSGTQRGRVRLNSVLGRPLSANTWQEVVVPMNQLGSGVGSINEIYLQDASGTDQSAVIVDDITVVR